MQVFLYVLFLHKLFKIIVLTLTLSPCVSSFLWFLLSNKWMFSYEYPLFCTIAQHICRQGFVNQNLFRTGSTFEILPLLASSWEITGTSDLLHGMRATASQLTLEPPVHFVLLKADLAFSLSQISTDLFSLSNCEACCFTSYTPPEIKAGES